MTKAEKAAIFAARRAAIKSIQNRPGFLNRIVGGQQDTEHYVAGIGVVVTLFWVETDGRHGAHIDARGQIHRESVLPLA